MYALQKHSRIMALYDVASSVSAQDEPDSAL